jgi:hypothetical protein
MVLNGTKKTGELPRWESVLILRFDRTLLMRLKVISTNDKNTTEVWSSHGDRALVGGLREGESVTSAPEEGDSMFL